MKSGAFRLLALGVSLLLAGCEGENKTSDKQESDKQEKRKSEEATKTGIVGKQFSDEEIEKWLPLLQ